MNDEYEKNDAPVRGRGAKEKPAPTAQPTSHPGGNASVVAIQYTSHDEVMLVDGRAEDANYKKLVFTVEEVDALRDRMEKEIVPILDKLAKRYSPYLLDHEMFTGQVAMMMDHGWPKEFLTKVIEEKFEDDQRDGPEALN